MINREELENKCKLAGIPLELFYKDKNELSFGGLRAIDEIAELREFNDKKKGEDVFDRPLLREEYEQLRERLKGIDFIVGWYIHPTRYRTVVTYIVNEEQETILDLLGGLKNSLKIKE